MTRFFDQGAARLEQVNAVRLLLEHGAEISPEDKAEFAVQHPKAVLIPRDDKCLTHDLPLLSKFLVEQSKKLSIAQGCHSKISVSKVGLVPGTILNKLLEILATASLVFLHFKYFCRVNYLH